MNHQEETFHYTYSAKQQEEIEAIRKKYAPAEENQDKLKQLRRLDESVTKKASVLSLMMGIAGALVFGFGMSLIMSELGRIFGSHQELTMPIGIGSGIIGIVLMSSAYSVYNHILRKQREKIAPEILKLTDELMK